MILAVLSLNAYQVQGKAWEGYWKPAGEFLKTVPVPTDRSPLEWMETVFLDFYAKGRLPTHRQIRVRKFFASDLPGELISSAVSPLNPGIAPEILRCFCERWTFRLAGILHQSPRAKTILFTGKTLAECLYLETGVLPDFPPWIPIDNRIRVLSNVLISSLTTRMPARGERDYEDVVHAFWTVVLKHLKQIPDLSFLTMAHLDSYLWQNSARIVDQIKNMKDL